MVISHWSLVTCISDFIALIAFIACESLPSLPSLPVNLNPKTENGERKILNIRSQFRFPIGIIFN